MVAKVRLSCKWVVAPFDSPLDVSGIAWDNLMGDFALDIPVLEFLAELSVFDMSMKQREPMLV